MAAIIDEFRQTRSGGPGVLDPGKAAGVEAKRQRTLVNGGAGVG